MKLLLILVKILWDVRQDFERLKIISLIKLWNPNQLLKRSYSVIHKTFEILQDPRESHKIVEDPEQNPLESSTILDKML